MTFIKLNSLDTFQAKAYRRDDESGAVVLWLHTDDATLEITVGYTDDEAAELAETLTAAAVQASAVADEWEVRPEESDLWVTLDRYRYWVSWGHQDQPGQPKQGYPSPEIAIYEAARWQAERGEFSAAWMGGEHGPSVRSIDAEIRAYHDAGGDKLLPLPGVVYEDGAIVRLAGDPWAYVVGRDYGDLGVMIYTDGDPDVYALAHHSQLTPHPDYDEHGVPWSDRCTAEDPCPVRAAQGGLSCEH